MSKRRETTERGGYGTRGRGSLRAESSRVSASSANRRCLPPQPSASAQRCWPRTTCPHRCVRFRDCDRQSSRRRMFHVACFCGHGSVSQGLRRGLLGPRCPSRNRDRQWRSLLSRRWKSTAQEPPECPRPRLRHCRGKARTDGAENASQRQESNGCARGGWLQADHDRNACENPGGKAVTCVSVGKCASDNQPTATLSMKRACKLRLRLSNPPTAAPSASPA